MNDMELNELADACRVIVDGAMADLGPDLGGSLLDLVADNLPRHDLSDLCRALVRCGFTHYEVPDALD